jgi:hypothetical protein
MADTLQIGLNLTGAENGPITSPLFTLSQTLLPTITAFSAVRMTFTPGVPVNNIQTVGTHAMLVVDDPAFASNLNLQLSVYDQGITTLYASISGGIDLAAGYATIPIPWQAIFRVPVAALTIRTESGTTIAQAPTVTFSATLYTW